MTHHHHHHHQPEHIHSHAPLDPQHKAFALGVGLNLLFVIIEAGYGFMAGSMALIADAGHNLSDVLSLLLAWGGSVLANKQATEYHTYGFRKATVMASLASAILLLIALGGIAWESVQRLLQPQIVDSKVVIIVATIGVIINIATALLFVAGQKHDLNIRAAFLHMVADAAVSVGVVVAGVILLFQPWLWLDPVLSLVIVVVILVGTWHLLQDSINLALDAIPKDIDIQEIKKYFTNLDNVSGFHDLHIWALSTTEIALTVHLVVDYYEIDNQLLQKIEQRLHQDFNISHITIQVETQSSDSYCRLNHERCI